MVIKSNFPDIELPQCGFIEFIFNSPFNVPEDKPIMIDAITEKYLTLGQIKDLSLRFGAGLQDLCDFKEDDVLAIYSSNRYDYIVPILGAIAANGAVTTANPNYNLQELTHQLKLTQAKVILCDPSNLSIAQQAASQLSIPHLFLFDQSSQLIQTRSLSIPHPIEPNQKPAYLCFSSGTTGQSKGVITTQSNLISNISQYVEIERHHLNSTDRILGLLPFFHLYGLSLILNVSIYLGIPSYVLSRFDLIEFSKVIQRHQITSTPLVPPLYLILAKTEGIRLDSVRWATSGAAPISIELLSLLKARFPNLKVRQAYGLTETSPVALIEPWDRLKVGSVGCLVPNSIAKIVNQTGEEVGVGEEGELWIKGPHVMKGYLHNPEATAEAIDDQGYLHTGDVARVDSDGYFYILDRIKELIKYNGFQVPPAELEGILIKSTIVKDCAVIGIYDEKQATEIPIGYVVLQPNVNPTDQVRQDLLKFVADQVIKYKQLKDIRFVDTIPKSPTGKILRRVLRDIALQESNKTRSNL